MEQKRLEKILDDCDLMVSNRSEPIMECVRRIQFCVGHRVWQHENKCAHLHGHNFIAFFHVCATDLDSLGRIIDFSELKGRLGGWIDSHWDHGFILNRLDEDAIKAVTSIKNQKLYLLDGNPTAENLARHLLQDVAPREMRGSGINVQKVVLWETENSYAAASL